MVRKVRRMLETVFAMFAIVLFCGITVHAKEVTVQNVNDIQAALNQAGSSTEAVTVIIPPGNYVVNDILKVRSNTIIQATGAEFTLRADLASAGHPILSVDNVQNVTVMGGTWTSSNGTPIVLQNANKNVVFDGVTVNASGSCRWGIEIHQGQQITVQNSTVNDGGIFAEKITELTLYKNVVNNSKFNGIRINTTEKCTIKENVVKNASTYGLHVQNDNGSTIQDNEISGSAASAQRVDNEHGEGLLVINSVNTAVVSNKILNTHCNEKTNGNGMIVAESTGVVVDDNVVSNSGNHGIQVTDHSTNITVKNNKVSNSSNAGIALSRDVQVSLVNNTISDSAVNGVACDGHSGRVTVTIEGGTITNTKGVESAANAAIWTDSTTGIISGVTIQDTKHNGITITNNSDVEIKDCKIFQSAVTGTRGIAVFASKASISGNVISGFSEYGIWANNNDGANITGGNNTVTLPGATSFTGNGIFVGKSTGTMNNNNLLFPSISNTTASGGNYFNDVEAGAIIDGKKYSVTITSGGKFSVSYPSVDTSKVAIYVKSPDGNVIILNAPNGTTLDSTPVSPADLEKIKAFVTRVYNNVLGRTPDPAGFESWVNALASGQQTGAGVVEGFFFSKELMEKNLSIEDYLELVYVTMMDRHSDAGGKQNWVNVYKQGFSERYILNGFVGSKEFGEICEEYGIVRGEVAMTEPRDQNRGVTEFVSRNYSKALRRAVDIKGLNDWCYAIIYEGKAPGEAVLGFIDSEEFKKKGHSDAEFVEIMYQTFFNRDPDSAGFADWMGRLQSGWSRLQVAEGFIGAEEFHKLVASFGL